MNQLNQPFDEIRIRRLETGYISEYRLCGNIVFKLFDSEGSEGTVLARMTLQMDKSTNVIS